MPFHADTAAMQAMLQAQVESLRIPGLLVAAATTDQPGLLVAVGTDARGQPLDQTALFPVASVTKLATALCILRLVEQDALSLDSRVARWLPDAASAMNGATIRQVLCHTAGLPLDLRGQLAAYAPGLTWAQLREACIVTPAERAAGVRVQYSNVGYGLLAAIAEHLTSQPFAEVLVSQVLEPLGIEAYLGVEPIRAPVVLADVRGKHAGGPLEPFNSAFWRSLALPWAGLITTASGALALIRAFLGTPAGFLSAELCAEAVRNQAGALGGGFIDPMVWEQCPWGLGPELRGNKRPHWAPDDNPASFGHSGASGCLAWADPDTGTAWVILGTRTADSGWLLRHGASISRAVVGE